MPIISAVKPPISIYVIRPNSPKYWNVSGSIGDNILNIKAKSGMESV